MAKSKALHGAEPFGRVLVTEHEGRVALVLPLNMTEHHETVADAVAEVSAELRELVRAYAILGRVQRRIDETALRWESRCYAPDATVAVARCVTLTECVRELRELATDTIPASLPAEPPRRPYEKPTVRASTPEEVARAQADQKKRGNQ